VGASYQITLVEQPLGWTVTEVVDGTEWLASSLKSGTDYSLTVQVCQDASCSDVSGSASAEQSTALEVWMVLGEEGTGQFTYATRLFPDGTNNPSAFTYGSEAGSLEGTTQAYYNLHGGQQVDGENGNAPTRLDEAALADGFSATEYPASDPDYGVKSAACMADHTCSQNSEMVVVGTSQVFPLASGKIRFQLETQGADGSGRVGYLDSVDGWEGGLSSWRKNPVRFRS
jgi:hypothetical protein